MNYAPALPLILGLALAGCTGDRGPSGATATADDVATALATNAAIEAAINERVAAEVEEFIIENRDGLTGAEGLRGEQGPPGAMGDPGEMGAPGEMGLPGQDATRWKVCGVLDHAFRADESVLSCGDWDECTQARICTVDELIAGAISRQGFSTATGTPQTNYLRQVGEQLIASGIVEAERPFAFVHSGYFATSCENYSDASVTTTDRFTAEQIPQSATVWPLIQLATNGAQEHNSSANAVSAHHAPCTITAPVICCDADGRPEVLPAQE